MVRVALGSQTQESILHAGRYQRILLQQGAVARNVFANGLRQGVLRKPVEQQVELTRFQSSNRCEEGSRGYSGFPFPFGLVVGERQGILQAGLEVAPQAME